MTAALMPAQSSNLLKQASPLSTKLGAYSYTIHTSGGTAIYTVTDGHETLRIPLEWAFGQGATGQTYLYQREGRWYESMVSYYKALGGLDVTLGNQSLTPRNLQEAAGRLTTAREAAQCFACHATNSGPAMIPGIQCERCHGSSELHLSATRQPMKRLEKLATEETSDFCGQCHRTWNDVAANGPRGILNVRFQPYRLASSKCYDAADKRISCTTCHDPHKTVETSARAYDVKCLACHTAKLTRHICKVATTDCVTCHMPKLELPGAHKKFADHRIRIVKANQLYPD